MAESRQPGTMKWEQRMALHNFTDGAFLKAVKIRRDK